MAKIYSAQTGNWTNTTTWTGGVVPGPGDDVYIINSHQVTMDIASITCGTIYLYNDTATAQTGGILYPYTGVATINANISNVGITSYSDGFSCIRPLNGCTNLDIYGNVTSAYHPYGIIYRNAASFSIPCYVKVHGDVATNATGGRSGIVFRTNNTNPAVSDTFHVTGNANIVHASLAAYPLTTGGYSTGVGYKVIIEGNLTASVAASNASGLFECINAAGILDLEIYGNIDQTVSNYCRLVGNSDTNNGYHTSASGLTHRVWVHGDWTFRQRNSTNYYAHYSLRGDLRVDGVIYGAGLAGITCSLGARHVQVAKVQPLNNVDIPGTTGYLYLRTAVVNTIIGEVTAVNGGVSSYAVLYWYPTNVGTLNVNIVRGGSLPAIQYLGTAAGVFNVNYLESAGAASPDIFTGKAAIVGTANKNILTTAVTVNLASYGNFPVDGPFRFKDETGTLVCVDNNSVSQTLSVQENVTIPLETDVRSGVIYGIANANTGTYDPGLDYAASLLALKNLALSIKAKTDQMNFTGADIDANVDESNSQLILDVSGIKSQTDQLAFTVNGVISDCGGTGGGTGTCDLTNVENSLTTISSDVTAVKAKTDQLTFTTGNVNSHPDNSATVTSISTNLGTANTNITAIKDQTDQLTFDTVSVTEYLGGDPSWANVSLLLHGNGTSGSTNIIDETGKIVTVNGNTNINTTTKKYGTGSIYFDGTGDYLSLADSSFFGFGVEDFTIECWVNTSSSSGIVLIDNRTTTHPGVFYISVGGTIGYYDPISGGVIGSTAIANSTWRHLAWVRSGSSLMMFVDGIIDATVSLTSQDFGSSRPLRVGIDYSNGSPFLGYLDDIRITKGLARYTANFTPPVAELLGQGTPTTYDQTQVIASGVSSAACDLTTVNNTLSTISGNVVSNGTNINAIKAKTDQLNFNGTKVLSDPALTIPDYTTRFDDIDASLVIIDSEVDNVQLDVTSIKAKTNQLTFNGAAVVADDGHAATLTSILSTIGTIDAAVTLIEAATSKLGFEEIHGEADPNFAQVTFIAEMEGTNGQNTYTAEVGGAATFGGNVVLSNVTSRLGGTSMNFGGANYAAFSNNSADNLGGNDFTIECSFYPTAIPASGDYSGVFCKRNSNSTMSWLLYMDGTSGAIVFLTGGTSPVSITHTIPLTVNQWYDCTISRTGNTIKFFVNGVLVSTSCTGMVCATVSAPVMMGKLSYDLSSYYFNGYIDHARITVGTGRYDLIDPVSPPVAAYPLATLGTLLGYKVVANCDSTVAIPADLTDRLNDLRARINAVHFTVDGQ